MRSSLFIAALLLSSAAEALVVGGAVTGGGALSAGGRFEALLPPFDASRPANTVGANTFESPGLYAFDEDPNIRVDREIAVDVGRSPMPGTIVASHYVFFDPQWGMSQRGHVRFDAPIIGVATQQGTLAASDWLANTGVTYLNPGLRGLEWEDAVWIDPEDPFRLEVSWIASDPGDYVRVFTEASPAFV
ncbi:MAG: hypothetical protein AAFR44_02365, partial [Pseudomonadota bacterium]